MSKGNWPGLEVFQELRHKELEEMIIACLRIN
jgi:hypothetical protein